MKWPFGTCHTKVNRGHKRNSHRQYDCGRRFWWWLPGEAWFYILQLKSQTIIRGILTDDRDKTTISD
jgi:hypothetical protein